mgnify:CR=1 FL=1
MTASYNLSLLGSNYNQGGSGAVARTTASKLQESVSVKDFGAVGDGVTDDTAAVQAWVNASSSNALYGAPRGYAPAGRYKITSTITFPSTYCDIRGDGMFHTQFMCDGVTGSVFKVAAITYFKPTWADFSIVDGTLTTTGTGIDLSAVTSEVYEGSFSNLYIVVKGTAFYAEKFFSIKMDSVLASSATSHAFLVACGPGVSWINCYAIKAGTGKAGYRLAGEIYMFACNGVDSADWWGVFGQSPSSADGFQTDFTSFTNDYPDVVLIGCNVENFTVGGISIQNSYRNVIFQGGKIDRNGLSSAYNSLIRVLGSSLSGTQTPIYLSPGAIYKGTGVPNGGAGLTNAWLYALTGGQPNFVDGSGILYQNAITSAYLGVYAGTVPTVRINATNDVYQDSSMNYTAISARRFSANVIRYVTSALTPVGAGQAIDVTGFTKVIVTPAAAASITTATFTQTTGTGLDYLRNGDLLIEAGNANLTVNHSASGNSTFRMAGAANVAMAAGQVLRFCWSSTSVQWIQV